MIRGVLHFLLDALLLWSHGLWYGFKGHRLVFICGDRFSVWGCDCGRVFRARLRRPC